MLVVKLVGGADVGMLLVEMKAVIAATAQAQARLN